MRKRDRGGYSLVELVIAILLVGILAALAVPQYIKSVEQTKYDAAVSLVNQIAVANKLFALDHAGMYVANEFPTAGSGTTNCGCTATTCAGYGLPSNQAATYSGMDSYDNNYGIACALVCCNYLGDHNWSSQSYNFWACAPGYGGPVCANCATPVAGASRAQTGSTATGISPYDGWGVCANMSGNMVTFSLTGGTLPPSPNE